MFACLVIFLIELNHLCIGVSALKDFTNKIFSALIPFMLGNEIDEPSSFKCEATVLLKKPFATLSRALKLLSFFVFLSIVITSIEVFNEARSLLALSFTDILFKILYAI